MTTSQRQPPHSCAIIGGGVIGLSIGWRLAQAGLSVTVFERDQAGRAASWAAAGMLAAGSEVEPGEEALFRLSRLAQELWPDFAAELEAASGLPVGLRTEGTLSIALTQDDLGRLRQVHALQQRLGVAARWLTRQEALSLEPHLNPRLAGAVLVAGDHQVDNRLLAEALAVAFVAAGGRLVIETGEVGVAVEAGRVRGVRVGGEQIAADTVIVAAGAWSRLVPGLPEPARPPVRPVKGQMLAVGMAPERPLLNHVLWAPKAYLVPRADGRLIVGATTEEKGFDPTLTAGGLLSLLDAAWRALPGIEELPVIETWTGFRPGSRDDAPILGETAVEGLVLATGHHRNGILLTPVTADAIARLVLTGETAEPIRPFALDRFAISDNRTKRWMSA